MSGGIVFDIQRFSLHDGPGIRTTVFLKGCPLRCQWCHNPESWFARPQLSFRPERCELCGRCAAVCTNGVHTFKGRRHEVRFEACAACGACVAQCPANAFAIIGQAKEPEDVMKAVMADKAYYSSTGGGLTVSGGEPLMQPDFLHDLLSLAHERGIHTCLETSGFAPQKTLERFLGLVDLFLFDIKAAPGRQHRYLTGVSSAPILANLDFLYRRGAAIRLRCPIIPGINDSDEHIKGIAALEKRYDKLLGIDILPYHDMGRAKWMRIGRPYSLTAMSTVDEGERASILRRLRVAGCAKATLDA